MYSPRYDRRLPPSDKRIRRCKSYRCRYLEKIKKNKKNRARAITMRCTYLYSTHREPVRRCSLLVRTSGLYLHLYVPSSNERFNSLPITENSCKIYIKRSVNTKNSVIKNSTICSNCSIRLQNSFSTIIILHNSHMVYILRE